MVRTERAFTLVELLLVLGLFSILTVALFQAFDFGARAFRQATSRQDAQSALRKAYTSLRDDLRKSHFQTLTLVSRTASEDGNEYPRDALALAGLKDWSAEESFDAVNGLPKWDRYIVYYGTLDGKLVRTYIDHDRPDYSAVPFPDLDPDIYLNDDPASNRGYQSTYRVLSGDLLELSAQLDPARDTVVVNCVLRSKKGKRNQVVMAVYPQNTWPKGADR